ncbi:Transcription elongation factor spt6 [Massospora cicadina]|nr:Transcription elongation factor spt6 [Massospora cicadina]
MSGSDSDDHYRSKAIRRRRQIIDEDEEDDSLVQDEEEEEEGEDTFEKDGFLVSDDEVEEEQPRKRSRRKKRSLSDEELDEDDLDLIKENAGITFEPNEPKLRRLQKKSTYSEDEDGQYSEDLGREYGQSNRDELGGMFADEDDPGAGEAYSGDDLDDFIEHDGLDNVEEDEDPKAREVRRHLLRKRRMEESRMLSESGVDVRSHDLVLEIFGDGADYEYAMHEPVPSRSIDEAGPAGLQSAFEPGELEARMLTSQDEMITQMDVPERMQELYGANIEVEANDYTREFEWVYNRFHDTCSSAALSEALRNPFTSEMVRKAIKACIEFFNAELLEVPFIWHYRKDYLLDAGSSLNNLKTVLQLEDLWEIYDMDRKYKAFHAQLLGFNKTLKGFEAEGRVDAYVRERCSKVDRIEEAQDILDYIAAHFVPPEQPATVAGQRVFRRPNSNSFLDRCKRAKLEGLVSEFGISPQQFGDNALEGSKVHHPRNPPYPPIEAASKYATHVFQTPELVLKAIESYIAHLMFHDLKLRQAFRQTFETNAAVTVIPTPRGRREIDSQHRFFSFKFVTEKPTMYMKDAQFLQMLEAEAQGLVTVQISLPGEQVFMANLVRLYLCDDLTSAHASAWNDARASIVKFACERHLFPYFKNWIRDRMRTIAEEFLAKACQEKAESRFNMAPYRPPHLPSETAPRVIALTNGAGSFRDPLIAVFLEANGQLEASLEFGDLRDQANRELLANFMESHPCDAIVVSGLGLNARHFLEKVRQVYQEAQCRPGLSAMPPCEIFMHTDEVARVYQASRLAEEEFPKLHPSARYCVSLARLLQDPMVEYASLREGLSNITFHPLQSLLPSEELNRSIERALVNVVSAVGIDLNRAVRNDRVAYLLRYVSGLGPRKSQHIIKRVTEAGGYIDSRNELITKCRVGMRVFINCSGFLRVKPAVDVLDITRIHPEDYVLARKMAADALEADEDEDDPDDPSKNVAELINNPRNILSDLDLEDYSRVLASKYHTQKQSTLSLIKSELRAPFADPRPGFVPTDSSVLFSQLTGETSASLCTNMIVAAEIRRRLGRGFICRLNSGLDGFLNNQNILNANAIREGIVVQCAVLNINFERFQVELSLLPNDLELCRQNTKEFYGPKGGGTDAYFDHIQFQDELNQCPEIYPNFPRPTSAMAHKAAAPNPMAEKHALFHPFTYKEAEAYLKSRQIGETVLRPSSNGSNHIAVTWKFYDDVYQHLDVVVHQEPDASATRDAAQSKYCLKVGGETYADLDELVVAHVEATKAKVDEMIHHPKFYKGSTQQLEEAITAASLTNPKQSIYGFCIYPRKPGCFALGFKLSAKARFEVWVVRAAPRHFRLNHVAYNDVASLINGFKRMITTMTSNRLGSQNPSAAPHPAGYTQAMTNLRHGPQLTSNPHLHPSRATQLPGPPPRNPAYR